MIMKLIKIKELNIEVMRTEEPNLYKNSKVPKGWKRIPLYQLIYVLERKYRTEFLRELEGKWNLFWVKKRKIDDYCSALVEYVGRLRVDGDDFDDYNKDLAFGVFVRELTCEDKSKEAGE